MDPTTLQVICGHKQDGTPVHESLLVEATSEGTYRLLRSPGLVLGVARDDVIRFDEVRELVEVVRRGGFVALQVHGPHEVADTVADQVSGLGGHLDGRAPQMTIYSIPVRAGFGAIEELANELYDAIRRPNGSTATSTTKTARHPSAGGSPSSSRAALSKARMPHHSTQSCTGGTLSTTRRTPMVGGPLLASSALVVFQPTTAQADQSSRGGDFRVPAVTATRLVDTRVGTGAPKAVVGAGKTITFTATGVAGVPSAGVQAVYLSVTAVGPTASTYLTVYPSLTTRPGMSNVNAAANVSAQSNSAVVPVGTDGKVTLYNNAGSVNVVVDLHGYFTSTTSGTGSGGIVPVTKTRVVDTVNGVGAPKAQIAAGKTLTMTLTGALVPAGSYAVFYDIAVKSTANGYVRVYPTGTSEPTATALNFLGGTTWALHGGVAKLSAGGQITLVNHGGAPIDVLLSVEGYVPPSSTAGAGYRAVQTRAASAVTVAATESPTSRSAAGPACRPVASRPRR